MTRALRAMIASLCLSAAIAPVAVAQVRPDSLRGAQPARRQQMEQQLRQRVWRVAKQRIGLTDEQMAKLEQSSQKFDARRRALNVEERSERQALRAELLAGDAANQDRVAASLDHLQQFQRRRLDLFAEEQKDLSGFMTPVQRAKFAALQEQLRRRVEMMRMQRAAARPAGRAPSVP